MPKKMLLYLIVCVFLLTFSALLTDSYAAQAEEGSGKEDSVGAGDGNTPISSIDKTSGPDTEKTPAVAKDASGDDKTSGISGNDKTSDADMEKSAKNAAGKSGRKGEMAGSQKADDPETANPEQLTYTGVTNKFLQKGGENSPIMSIYYPQFGNKAVDKAMHEFAEAQINDYEADISEALEDGAEKPASFDMWDMTGFFTLERPNPDVVSVLFNVYSYSGGAHGMLQLTTLNYDLRTGKRLLLSDIFADPEKALNIFGENAANKLRNELGSDADEDMITSGTAPEENNFQNLTLTPGGLFIEFQPYQVGPWSIGPQRVEMALEDMKDAGPNPDIWPVLKSNEEKKAVPAE